MAMDENEQLAQEHDKPSSEPMQDQPDAQQAEEPAGGAASSEPDAAGAPMQQKRSRSRERKATASAPEAMTTGAAAPAAEPDIELPEEQPDAPALKVSPTAAEPVPVPDGGTSGDETLGAGGVQPPQEDEILEAADELRARVAKLIAAEARARGLPTPALATAAEAPAAKPTAPRPAESQDRTWRKPIDKRVEAVDEDECGGDLEVVVVARRPAMDIVRGKRARKGGDEEVDYIAGATV